MQQRAVRIGRKFTTGHCPATVEFRSVYAVTPAGYSLDAPDTSRNRHSVLVSFDSGHLARPNPTRPVDTNHRVTPVKAFQKNTGFAMRLGHGRCPYNYNALEYYRLLTSPDAKVDVTHRLRQLHTRQHARQWKG